jgi:hypothetical protein
MDDRLPVVWRDFLRMERFERFLEGIGSSSGIPPPTPSLLDELDDFLVFSLDSQVLPHCDSVCSYICRLLELYSTANEQSEVSICLKVLTLCHSLRPHLVSESQIAPIIDILTKMVTDLRDKRQLLALSVLLDCLSLFRCSRPELIIRLLEWMTTYVKRSIPSFETANHDFLLLIVQTYRSFLLIASRAAIPFVSPFIDQLVNLIGASLGSCAANDMAELLASKSLRILAKLIDSASQTNQPGSQIVINLQTIQLFQSLKTQIPNELRFARIFQNHLVCICSLFGLEERLRPPELLEFFRAQMINNLRFFIHPPFQGSNRLRLFLRSFLVLNKADRKKSLTSFDTILPDVWKLLTSLPGQSTTWVSSIVSSLFSSGLFKENRFLSLTLLSEIISVLRLFEVDFDIRKLDIMGWVDTNRCTMKLFHGILQADLPTQFDPALLSVLSNLIHSFAFFLGQVSLFSHGAAPEVARNLMNQIDQKEFREKISQHFDEFSKIFTILPSFFLGPLFAKNLFCLLPTKPWHAWHINVHESIMQGLNDAESYFSAFFRLFQKDSMNFFSLQPRFCWT